MFNGKDFTGWVDVTTDPSTWTMTKDGMIHCTGKPIGELRTTRMYQNYIMELEWRHLRPKGNAGIFMWADDITAKGQPFHRGIEVQILDHAYGKSNWFTTHGDIFPIHGAKMIALTGKNKGKNGRAFPTEHRGNGSPKWNHYRITCQDGNITLAVNGKVVTKGTGASPRKGYICLESEGGIVDYRNVRIKELPDTPIKPEHVAIADRGYRCLYRGVNLKGWTLAEAKTWQPRDWNLIHSTKAKAKDRSIATDERFGDFGFVVDVRYTGLPSKLAIQLRGSDATAILIDPADKAFAALIPKKNPEKGGRWCRFEGELRGDRLTLSLDGKELFRDKTLKNAPAKGPVRIVPTGPVALANIFVRALK